MIGEKLDVLAFAAHCDDVEITSGGLMIKFADLGYKIGVCDLTAGEMGTKGSKADRLAESACAANVMGVTMRTNLELPDAGLEMKRQYAFEMVGIIRRHRPHLVILPYWEQRHPDHRICSFLGQDACYLSGLQKLDVEGDSHRPHKILFSTYYRDARPSFLVDITEQHERKLDSVRCYKTQFDGTPQSKEIFNPGVDIIEYITARDRNLGINIKVKYAEAYIQKEPVSIDDPMTLKVRSV
jgi:bacillithiol biosynthesis deacetylase BshB1